VTNEKELVRFSRQASIVFLVPRKDEFKESEDILGMCWVVEVMVCRRLPGREPIVGKRDRVPCEYGKLAGQGCMISLVFPDAVTISIRSRANEDGLPHALHAPPWMKQTRGDVAGVSNRCFGT
jgi:hypothetical protein